PAATMPAAPARQAERAGTPERDSAESQYRGENLRPARTWLRLPPWCGLVAGLPRAAARPICNRSFGSRRHRLRYAASLALRVVSSLACGACWREAVRAEGLRVRRHGYRRGAVVNRLLRWRYVGLDKGGQALGCDGRGLVLCLDGSRFRTVGLLAGRHVLLVL